MNNGFYASCLVMLGAAGLGYWIWSDAAPAPKPPRPAADPGLSSNFKASATPEKLPQFSAGNIIEVIDLSDAFRPTGDELALQQVFAGLEAREYLPFPRSADRELLPVPRLQSSSLIPDAAQEASNSPSPFDLLRDRLASLMAASSAEVLSQILPAKGNAPETDVEQP